MDYEEMLKISPYSLERKEKQALLTERLKDLTKKHMENCREYRDMLESTGYDAENVTSYEDIPFLPVRLFKEKDLKSVPDDEIVKTMTSSGTSGQRTSKIYLDKATSANQQKTMVKIVSEYTGSSRMPMIIIDCPSVVKDRRMFSARGAGILGFSIFGSKKMYALDDDMRLNVDELRNFTETYKDGKILLFGFTFMVWKHFYQELVRIKEETGETFDLSNAVLIHGGGWKKLVSEAVSPEEFHDRLRGVCGLDDIHDYYGMVEQTGCIYMQCECGHLHASVFSDVIVRRPEDFSVADVGEKGIMQVVSAIPESYPGHSLLTEDEGVILGEDDCPCGRKGKYFKILGRLSNAEIRGCSDTYAAEHTAKAAGISQANSDSGKSVEQSGDSQPNSDGGKSVAQAGDSQTSAGSGKSVAQLGISQASAGSGKSVEQSGTSQPNSDSGKSVEQSGTSQTNSGMGKSAVQAGEVHTGAESRYALGKLSFLVGDGKILGNMASAPVKEAFDNGIIEFLDDLSKKLMGSRAARNYPDVVSLGFWLRSSSVASLKKRFCGGSGMENDDGNIKVGRGAAFHIAPSNVAVNFAYSLAAGLMSGNANVVRVPTKEFPQVAIITEAINAALDDYPDMRRYICLVRYERDSRINDYLSGMCDVRIVWGGDATIEQLRNSPLKARATEVTFADRYSLALIDSDEYMASDDKERIASDFFNDTYLTDQNACTSPRVVVWSGAQREAAKEIFWKKLHNLVLQKYNFQPVMAVDKLTQRYMAAMAVEEIGHVSAASEIEKIGHENDSPDAGKTGQNSHESGDYTKKSAHDNRLVRVSVERLTPKLMDYRGNCGYFYEYDCDDIMEIRDFCDDTHCQTIGLLGDKRILRPLVTSGIRGVDRVAAIGHTMDFDLNWDGYNLVSALTRTVTI